MTAQLLGISQADLHGLIANPGDFAQYLSKRTTTAQLDKLVDAGIMDKIPMLTGEVNEYMARKYGLPLGTTDLFIADPMEATKVSRLGGQSPPPFLTSLSLLASSPSIPSLNS
jgi:hypothetical protein